MRSEEEIEIEVHIGEGRITKDNLRVILLLNGFHSISLNFWQHAYIKEISENQRLVLCFHEDSSILHMYLTTKDGESYADSQIFVKYLDELEKHILYTYDIDLKLRLNLD